MHRTWVALAVSSLLGASGPVFADGIYIGAGIARADPEDLPKRTAWTLFANYRFTEYAALEAGFWDLGAQHFDGIRGYLYGYDHSLRQYYAQAQGRLPLRNGFAVVAQGGFARTDHRIGNVRPGTGSPPPGVVLPAVYLEPSRPPDETTAVWGVGLDWDSAHRLGLRARWENHDTHYGDLGALPLSVLSLSVTWAF